MMTKYLAPFMACCLTLLPTLTAETAPPAGDVFDELAVYNYGDSSNAGERADKLIQETPVSGHGAIEERLIAVVASAQATQAGKALACRMLQQIGTDRAVPALSGILSDEILADYARLVLERLNSPAANKAMRDALDGAPDSVKVGLLGSLAETRDNESVAQAARLASHAHAAVAGAAMQALGKIGGIEAAKSLTKLNVPANLQPVRMQALIDCAATLAKPEAAAVYQHVLQGPAGATRVAALKGLVAADPAKAAPLLAKALLSDDARTMSAAIGIIADSEGEPVTIAVMDTLDSLPPFKKARVLAALGTRGDRTALPAIIAGIKSEHAIVRDAAIDAISKLGDARSIPTLLGMADTSESGAPVTHVITRMTGDGVDAALIAALDDRTLRGPAIAALRARGCKTAAPKLLELVTDSDADVRKAAWTGLGSLAGDEHIDAIMKKLVKLDAPDELTLAQAVVKRLTAQAADRTAAFRTVAAYYAKAPDASKEFIIELGPVSGDPVALKLEQKALKSDNAAFRDKALRALAAWPNATAAADLLALAKSAKSDLDQIVALRGYIKLAQNGVGLDAGRQVNMLRTAAALCTRADEKRLVISGLRTVPHPGALELLSEYVKDTSVSREAELAAADLAWDLRSSYPDKVTTLAQTLAQSSDQAVSKKATETLTAIARGSIYVQTWLVSDAFQGNPEELFNKDLGPETGKPDVRWTLLSKGLREDRVDLHEQLGALDNACAYVKTTIVVPAEQPARLEMGSDDAIKAWVNGAPVHAYFGSRGVNPGQDVVNIVLKKGDNSVLLKIVDLAGDWGFSCRIVKPDGTPIEGMGILAR